MVQFETNSRGARLFNRLSPQLSFDVGSSHTRVMVGGAVMWHQPTLLAWHAQQKAVVAIGDEAYRLAGKTPQAVQLISPIKNGVVADIPMTVAFIEGVVRYIQTKDKAQSFFPPQATLAVPSSISPVEIEQFKRVFSAAGIHIQHVVAKPQAVVQKLGAKGQTAVGTIDIGAETIEVGLFVDQAPVAMTTILSLGGNEFTTLVQEQIKMQYRCHVGWQTAEKIKHEVGSVWLNGSEAPPVIVVRGRDVNSDLLMTIKISATDFEPFFQQLLEDIMVELRLFFTQQPAEVVTQAVESGLYLTGGASLLRGLQQALAEHMRAEIVVSKQPTLDVILGLKQQRS
jgi:rod shape-determining protein MreB and related proteins